MTDRPQDTPTDGVHVIPGEVPEGVVPPSTSTATPEPNVYEANRALFEELDRESAAANAAYDRDDMDAWATHAGRAAELYREIAEALGWDVSAPRYDQEETDA